MCVDGGLNLLRAFSTRNTITRCRSEPPVRFRVSVVVAVLVLTGCNANQAINPSSQPPSQVFAGHYVDYNPYDPIRATHRTTPGAAVAVAVAVEAGAARLAGRNRPKKTQRGDLALTHDQGLVAVRRGALVFRTTISPP